MIEGKTYVRRSADGAFRVGEFDISLDSVVIAFQQGYSAETIQQMYPALSLEEVYGAVAFYLANQTEIHDYLKTQEQRWDELRRSCNENPSPVVARLRALRHSKSALP